MTRILDSEVYQKLSKKDKDKYLDYLMNESPENIEQVDVKYRITFDDNEDVFEYESDEALIEWLEEQALQDEETEEFKTLAEVLKD